LVEGGVIVKIIVVVVSFHDVVT